MDLVPLLHMDVMEKDNIPNTHLRFLLLTNSSWTIRVEEPYQEATFGYSVFHGVLSRVAESEVKYPTPTPNFPKFTTPPP